MSDAKKTVSLTLSQDEAWHLALFIKRVGWSEIRGNAQDEAEANAIRAALDRAQKELAEAGIAPR